MDRAADGLGEAIRKRRVTNGLSQQVLADKLSVSQPMVSFWELGKAKPDPQQVKKLNVILGDLTQPDEVSDQSLPPIALWLTRALSKKNMTANELARKAGVSAPTIYNLLSGGAQNPQQRTLKALENALGESFERTEDPKESFEGKGVGQ
jgi:transcriptional regulator with XRE-family HTH domain